MKNIHKPQWRKISKYALWVFVALSGLFITFMLSIHAGAWGPIPSEKSLSDLSYQKATEVYSADSVLIGKYYLFDRQPVSYEQLPEHLVHALVSIEDERFYEHKGIDYPSLMRVALKTVLLQDESAGGGSTLSQQLVKNLYPREHGSKLGLVADKFREMIIASRLESIYTKKEILQHYLNTVSFGGNTFGIESAALKFYNKPASDLSMVEAATLVGMLKATYAYNPRLFPERSITRRNLVLLAMARNEHIDNSQLDSLQGLPLSLDYREYDHDQGIAPYFREEVRKQLKRWADKERENGQEYNIYTSGLKVYTTLNFKMQQLAEEAMTEHMKGLQQQFEKSHGKNAPWETDKTLIRKAVRQSPAFRKLSASGLSEEAVMDSLSVKRSMTLPSWKGDTTLLMSSIDSVRYLMKYLNVGSLGIDPQSGEVLTWIGGINYKYFKYDHISQSERQVGSTFKPIVYTAALEAGVEPCNYYSAREVAYENMEGWSPGNSGDKDEAYLNYSMEEALSNSVNTVAVKVLEDAGINRTLQLAKKMGITADLPAQPSLALGTGAVSIPELAGAYASYVNDGIPVKPYLIKRVTSGNDSLLMEHRQEDRPGPAYSEQNRQLMIEMMQATVNQGTAARIRSTYGLRNDLAGKTGTTQNNKDAWFVAISPELVHVSWVGLDRHEIGFRSTSLGQGANAALPLFATLLQKMNKEKSFNPITRARFQPPSGEVARLLDCEPVKKDGFLKRLFTNPDKKKKKKFKSKD
ncbi:transglycosylase domain-containing protein [Zeaxanthinibacter sp. PT1]|uniref:transglycosylase domain-containing protein n=1 Tax=Zeaxanthinibacter TaxID=561554 RepID=UPI00234A8FFA|nr:transglycosylase domain-containing protein [Zeaxanthinibacter sp. PT1]MDC6351881.1 transglycosylase domain-containing protein [Zeaxanthinibacter sp. PT1]